MAELMCKTGKIACLLLAVQAGLITVGCGQVSEDITATRFLPEDQAKQIMREEMEKQGFVLSGEDVQAGVDKITYVEKQWDPFSRVRLDSTLYPAFSECLRECDLAYADSGVVLEYDAEMDCEVSPYASPYLRGTFTTEDQQTQYFGYFPGITLDEGDYNSVETLREILRNQVESFAEWLKAQEMNP